MTFNRPKSYNPPLRAISEPLEDGSALYVVDRPGWEISVKTTRDNCCQILRWLDERAPLDWDFPGLRMYPGDTWVKMHNKYRLSTEYLQEINIKRGFGPLGASQHVVVFNPRVAMLMRLQFQTYKRGTRFTEKRIN